MLETLRKEDRSARVIYFNLKYKQPLPFNINEKVMADARKHMASADAQLYLCEDGDIFILATTMSSKDGKQLMLEVAGYVGMLVTDRWANFYELPLHTNLLLAALEQKAERRRQEAATQKKMYEQKMLERKRQAILSSGITGNAEDIKMRRLSRNEPEFMIIEDDVFSRRLVENVLQKRYALTGLGEATNALDTYTRVAPNLLFLDINLPDVTGHELLEKIVALDPDAYVIMLSGNADKDNIVQAMSLGAKGFIAKPFTKEKLFQYINRCPTIIH